MSNTSSFESGKLNGRIDTLGEHIVKYGDVSYGPVSVSEDSVISIANPYASNNCLGAILKSGGGSGGYAKGFVSLAGDNIRFVPKWNDSNVSMVFTVLYTP